jgi:2-dehydro-3-deoxy-D-arabinonate dehydratase
MRLYRTTRGVTVENDGKWYALHETSFDDLVMRDDLAAWLRAEIARSAPQLEEGQLLAPLQSQEVWAAGVTYLRSRDARMDESKEAGASRFYDRVYDAERPELFFKATAARVVGHGGQLRRRADSRWIVPEPELALLMNPRGKIIGYTIGNDMSCRDIEGENPLYLPQAKIYEGACALGPGVLIAEEELPSSTSIRISVRRGEREPFSGATSLTQMKRSLVELAQWLFREQTFPVGCYLLTGTGVIPPDDFTLERGDEVAIAIEGIGELVNTVAN